MWRIAATLQADLASDLARLPTLAASLLSGSGWLGAPLSSATVLLTAALLILPLLLSWRSRSTDLGRVGTPAKKKRLMQRRLSTMGGSLQSVPR